MRAFPGAKKKYAYQFGMVKADQSAIARNSYW